MNEGSVSFRAAYHGCRNSDDELWRDQHLLPAKVLYWIREIKRSPDTMKAAAILVVNGKFGGQAFSWFSYRYDCTCNVSERRRMGSATTQTTVATSPLASNGAYLHPTSSCK